MRCIWFAENGLVSMFRQRFLAKRLCQKFYCGVILITQVLLIVIAVLLFGFIIFIHEFGHFFTAKLSGIRVNEFSIGMGPKLLQFGKKETKYSLRLLPIGGYCAMEGEDEESDDERAFGNGVLALGSRFFGLFDGEHVFAGQGGAGAAYRHRLSRVDGNRGGGDGVAGSRVPA